ncbi:sulfurtransferase [Microbacterium hatanonis]|uniref:Sulfurtransferase n=1 Tax=Microbacterium hatanonis TaxID=404366 RepID=A0A5C8HUD9_9MICO|nr:sulfurtransferase [Microbacterium hatanonis]TXK09713.1 sulfurtransferase [Microbacterium hatanonis]
MSNLVSVSELSELLEAGAPVRVLDVRWRLDKPDGRAEYLDGHLPGAVYVDLGGELADHAVPDRGRHPLPTTADLERSARRWGLHDGDIVVAYDHARGLAAARAWWLLRRAGVDIRVLDGGLPAWVAAGGALETGEVTAPRGDVHLTDSIVGVIDIDEAAAFPRVGVLLDVRAPERYRGDVEPLDPIGGHIPGAVNLPTPVHLADDGTLRRPDELRATFAEAGVTEGTPVAVYCGSGITAAHTALALEEAGIEALVFPGSWSEWSTAPGRPVARGDAPSGAGPAE